MNRKKSFHFVENLKVSIYDKNSLKVHKISCIKSVNLKKKNQIVRYRSYFYNKFVEIIICLLKKKKKIFVASYITEEQAYVI